MSYIQLITPNINIGATRGMCLGYVDNAIGAVYPYRSYSAQIAHDTAKAKGWVTLNQDYPRNVWFVLFWSIDNGQYAGLGHVALAYVDSSGNMQIHDSEVHSGARQAYRSVSELVNWFGSGGTRMTFLGWSIGCDGVKIIDTPKKQATASTTQNKTKKKVGDLMLLFRPSNAAEVYFLVGNKYTHVKSEADLEKIKTMMTKAGYDTWVHTDLDQIKYIKKIAEEAK